MANLDKILNALVQSPLCDDCLAEVAVVKRRQQVNIICHKAEDKGFLKRGRTSCSRCKKIKIVNILLRQGELRPIKLPEQHSTIPKRNLPRHKVEEILRKDDRPWYWEGNVQASIAKYLVSNGYQIEQSANTEIREAGVDLIAKSPTGTRLLVTVKGRPEAHPNPQGRHWFAEGIFDLVRYRQDKPKSILVFGLPDGFVTYLKLAKRVVWLIENLPFQFFWVGKDGNVKVE